MNVNNVNNVSVSSTFPRRKKRKIFIHHKKRRSSTKDYEMIDRIEIIIETEYVVVNNNINLKDRESIEIHANKDGT